MRRVGITGGIGSGKSTVARIFGALGIPVYEADKRANELMETDAAIVAALRVLLGDEVYTPDGKYNRKVAATKVFGHQKLLQQVNAVVHPAVGKDFEAWAARQDSPYVLKEAAIVSAGSTAPDQIIVVNSPIALRIARIKARDGRSEEQIEAIMRSQKSEAEFLALADFVIYNNEDEFLIPQVLKVDAILRASPRPT